MRAYNKAMAQKAKQKTQKVRVFLAVDSAGQKGLGFSKEEALDSLHFQDAPSMPFTEQVLTFEVSCTLPTVEVREVQAKYVGASKPVLTTPLLEAARDAADIAAAKKALEDPTRISSDKAWDLDGLGKGADRG